MKSSIGYLIRKLVSYTACGMLSLSLIVPNAASAQQYVASTSQDVNSETGASAAVNNRTFAEGAPNGNSATVTASGIVVEILGVNVTRASDASLTLTFNSPIPAGKTTYVRITQLTQTGLNLDLSSLVNILGLLENNTIGVASNGGATAKQLVRDKSGALFLAVTPTNAYTNITLIVDFGNSTNQLLGLALGRITLGVEHAVTYETTEFTPCAATDFAFAGLDPNESGIAITLTDALQDPERAIDGVITPTNFSLLQNGAVAAASTVSQTIFLGKTASSTNQIVATISKPAALANLGVLENVTIQAYMGSTPVGPARDIEGLLLDLDLLTLFGNDALVAVSFTPGVAHDRIVVTSTTILNANLFTGLRIHELSSRPPVVFTGGVLASGREKDPLSVNISSAIAGAGESGFGIQCGVPSDYTYQLFNVTNGRTMAGTLPASLTFNNGVLSGTPLVDDAGTYTFDVRAVNAYGQSDVALFQIQIDPALPVTLVSFKAVSEGSTAALSWSTAEEVNSDRFDIERSQNGKNWAKIGSVASNHESKVNRYYSFSDAAPLKGQNLYRLKMVDFDGTFAYSHIENLSFNTNALVYPNPVASNENLTVNVADWSKVKVVKVVSATGKVVFEASNALLSGINTKNLVAGAYVVQVTLIDGTTSTQRFVRL